MTQGQLAEAISASKILINKIENGQVRLSLSTARQISGVTLLDTHQLMANRDPDDPRSGFNGEPLTRELWETYKDFKPSKRLFAQALKQARASLESLLADSAAFHRFPFVVSRLRDAFNEIRVDFNLVGRRAGSANKPKRRLP
jgi:DNA-binding XRE family transcriptional regulator